VAKIENLTMILSLLHCLLDRTTKFGLRDDFWAIPNIATGSQTIENKAKRKVHDMNDCVLVRSLL
jgi:hypothetical protein